MRTAHGCTETRIGESGDSPGLLGNIQLKTSAATLARADPKLAAVPPEQIRLLLRQFVLDGNTLDVRTETRIEYVAEDPDHPYWYRAVIPAAGFSRGIFVEVRLVDQDPDDPWVKIVSAHPQV